VADGRHVEAFLEMLSAERGAARNTLAAYGADLADFAAHARRFAQTAHGPMQHQPGHGQRSDGAGLMPALRANRSVASASSYLIGRQRPARSPGRVAWNLSVAFTGSGGWPNASSSTSLTKPDGDTSRA
jgi:hypothetical protein